MNREDIINTIGKVLMSLSIPIILIGVGITMFSGLFEKDNSIGIIITIFGVVLFLPIFLIIIIKLLTDDGLRGKSDR